MKRLLFQITDLYYGNANKFGFLSLILFANHIDRKSAQVYYNNHTLTMEKFQQRR